METGQLGCGVGLRLQLKQLTASLPSGLTGLYGDYATCYYCI